MGSMINKNRITQVCVLVKDVEKVSQNWADFLGIQRPPLVTTEAYEVTHATYNGEPCHGLLRQCNIDLDNTQIEIVQPLGDEPSYWHDYLMEHGEGLHHIAFFTKDMDGALKELRTEGIPLIQRGSWPDEPVDGQYAYVDSIAKLKCCLELLSYEKPALTSLDYLRILVEDIHSTTIATLDENGRPSTRVIDMMLYDENGVYFLTAKGKAFYKQLMEQKYISLSSIKDKRSISLRGKIRNIGSERLDEIFEKNTYMQSIYPGDTRSALEVFQLYEAEGEFFDISDPSNVTRGSIVIGEKESEVHGYFIEDTCVGCKSCEDVCPQKCIDTFDIPFAIDQSHCLHCGRCVEVCPVEAVKVIP